jgi:hypothetical protein
MEIWQKVEEVRRENEARLQTQKATLCGRIATVPKTPGGAGIHGTLSETSLKNILHKFNNLNLRVYNESALPLD